MKKVVSIVLVLAMLIGGATICSAAATVTEIPGSVPVDVDGVYSPEDPNVFYSNSDKEGNFVVERGEKTKINVDPVSDRKDQKLVVRFFIPGDQNAIDWLDETVDGLNKEISPFEIFYMDAKGNRVELEKGDKISLSVESTDVIIKSVAPDGSVVELPFTVNGNVITFEAPGGKFCYYAVALKSGTPGTNPDTGILFDEVSWFAILMMSASALGVLLLVRKRALDLDLM